MKRIMLQVSIIYFLITNLILTGCQAQTPSGTVKLYLEGVKRSSEGAFSQLIDETSVSNHELAPELEQEIHEIIQRISYQINNEVIKNDTACVSVTVYGPDLAKVLMDYKNEMIEQSQKQAGQSRTLSMEEEQKISLAVLLETLKEVPFFERTADIKLIKSQDGWRLEERNEGLLYVLFNLQTSMMTP